MSKIERYTCDVCSGGRKVAGRLGSTMYLVEVDSVVVPAKNVCEDCVQQFARSLRLVGLYVVVLERNTLRLTPSALGHTPFRGMVVVRPYDDDDVSEGACQPCV